MEFVKEVWNANVFLGSYSQILVKKSRFLRERLRWWNINVFGWVDLKIEEGVDTLNSIEDAMVYSSGAMSKEQLKSRSESQNLIWNNLFFKKSMLK